MPTGIQDHQRQQSAEVHGSVSEHVSQVTRVHGRSARLDMAGLGMADLGGANLGITDDNITNGT